MSDDTESTPDILFRSNKRRKIFRKRNIDEDGEALQDSIDGTLAATTTHGSDTETPAQVVRRPIAKKQGIGFSSSGAPVATNTDAVEEMSLVSFLKEQEQAAETNRFVAPAEKVEVVEDKHLTAYVDSKLAELRSASQTPARHDGVHSRSQVVAQQRNQITSPVTGSITSNSTHQGANQTQDHASARQSTTRKPRRGPRPKDPTELAREAMVDQIFRESQVPLYSPSVNTSITTDKTSSEIDNDEAAATAFKEQFLADLAEQNRHRKAPAPPKDSKGAAQAPSGPKLGGSRQQRERMRALEEARAAAGGSGGGSGAGKR